MFTLNLTKISSPDDLMEDVSRELESLLSLRRPDHNSELALIKKAFYLLLSTPPTVLSCQFIDDLTQFYKCRYYHLADKLVCYLESVSYEQSNLCELVLGMLNNYAEDLALSKASNGCLIQMLNLYSKSNLNSPNFYRDLLACINWVYKDIEFPSSFFEIGLNLRVDQWSKAFSQEHKEKWIAKGFKEETIDFSRAMELLLFNIKEDRQVRVEKRISSQCLAQLFDVLVPSEQVGTNQKERYHLLLCHFFRFIYNRRYLKKNFSSHAVIIRKQVGVVEHKQEEKVVQPAQILQAAEPTVESRSYGAMDEIPLMQSNSPSRLDEVRWAQHSQPNSDDDDPWEQQQKGDDDSKGSPNSLVTLQRRLPCLWRDALLSETSELTTKRNHAFALLRLISPEIRDALNDPNQGNYTEKIVGATSLEQIEVIIEELKAFLPSEVSEVSESSESSVRSQRSAASRGAMPGLSPV